MSPNCQTLSSSCGAGAAADERRRSERYPYVVEAWLSSDSTEPIELKTANLSRHGVRLTLERPLTVGEFFTIEIGVGRQALLSEVRVVSCFATEDGMYDVGAEFC